jgi:hypothetical protein
MKNSALRLTFWNEEYKVTHTEHKILGKHSDKSNKDLQAELIQSKLFLVRILLVIRRCIC